MFCIYEKGEEVELIEKDGVHRFIGNDRVHKKGIRETLDRNDTNAGASSR